jgi:hypothetical protein
MVKAFCMRKGYQRRPALDSPPGRRFNLSMNTNQLDSEIRALIDQFSSKFRELLGLAALDSVQVALREGEGTPVRSGPGRPRGSAKTASGMSGTRGPAYPLSAMSSSRRRVRRSSADDEAVADQVLTYVGSNPGARLEEIGRGLGTDTARLKLPVKELLASGRVRTEGQKRGTKYFMGGGANGRRKPIQRTKKRARHRKA